MDNLKFILIQKKVTLMMTLYSCAYGREENLESAMFQQYLWQS